ncbi:uncharacterized protein LOC112555074 [Pomacea canaliculata]|uniref:uncharacterized protein LOC112555074 n=1 Tax=Pomacea canaliculata TaxID=400727 RepID=UPI000D730C8A|nr:uncharacterized protein LOC112555074 [Pomacea canaliculata]
MYFAKARKQMEEQDMQEVQEKLEKYQRADTARVLQQAKSSRTEDSSSRQTRDDFRPEELPDGAFVSPKHTPSHSASVSKSDPATFSSVAEYIGSFSVTGTDEDARARVVETQLQALRSVTKSKKVVLIISLGGVKVFSSDLQTLYMFHELKRIAYATCDPDHCQFSFLAREPKGQMNLQYCHVFTTLTPDQATELNTIIGNAFKMAYAQQRERQPTFHELIEAQVAEQRAKFLEIEKQAQAELQRKLAEIARPTPFSQQAIQRMEQRRQAQEDLTAEPEVVGRQRVWAKQAVDKVQHRFSLHEVSMPSTSQPIPSRLSEPHALPSSSSDKSAKGAGGGKSYVHKNITKHNSAPLFPAQLPSPSDEPPAQGSRCRVSYPTTHCQHRPFECPSSPRKIPNSKGPLSLCSRMRLTAGFFQMGAKHSQSNRHPRQQHRCALMQVRGKQIRKPSDMNRCGTRSTWRTGPSHQCLPVLAHHRKQHESAAAAAATSATTISPRRPPGSDLPPATSGAAWTTTVACPPLPPHLPLCPRPNRTMV